MPPSRTLLRTLHTAVIALLAGVPCVATGKENMFSEQIAPLLAKRCLSCHNESTSQGGVSFTSKSELVESGVVVEGDAQASYLLELVTPEDGRAAMPKNGAPLAPEEVAAIRNWITSGAPWPEEVRLSPAEVSDRNWWSLKPLARRATPPSTSAEIATGDQRLQRTKTATPNNPVDTFIDHQLAEKGLVAVAEADPLTLIRRVTYDLTGLPPTPAEVDDFLDQHQVDSDTAWQSLVDRLLSSPAFGEKFAQHWLDLARYAETHGYDKDKPRENAWPYRDYVIRSFNSDKPYPRFVQEQVAGDVLFPGEPDGTLGLGFLAAGPWDFIAHWEVGEEKVDGRIAKHLDRDEMVSAVFNVFLSTTVQCAQCHDHKFDPIRTVDYYRLHAVFAAVDRADRIYAGVGPQQQRERQRVEEEIAKLRRERDQVEQAVQRELHERVASVDERIRDLEKKIAPLEPAYGYHSQLEEAQSAEKWVQVDLGESQRLSQVKVIPAYDDFAGIGAGFGFPVRFRIEVSNDPGFADDVRVLLDATDADYPNPGLAPVTVDARGDAIQYLRVTATKLARRRDAFIFALGELQAIVEPGGENVASSVAVSAKDSIESLPRWSSANLTDGVYYGARLDAGQHAKLIKLEQRRAEVEAEVRSPQITRRLSAIGQRLQRLNTELASFPEGSRVYAVATDFAAGGKFVPTSGVPRPIYLLDRGDLRAPLEPVSPGAPKLWDAAPSRFLSAEQWDEGAARAALADYLTRDDNPLLWRSIVNRLWQWTFGQPLVGTPNDFGRMGMQPTHASLLDEFAAQLRDDPHHSLKRLIRLLVTSNAYRRASTHHAANARVDAENNFHWRANRRRLTAEEFRDSVLAVCGYLRLGERGGPSFRDFVIERPQHSPHYEYGLHDPANSETHRRSVYRFVVRSQPQPMLTVLDCADPSISVAQRDESTTALQALTQWNSRLVAFASDRFAQRLQREVEGEPEAIVRRACRIAWGRNPRATEQAVLLELLDEAGPETLCRVIINSSVFTYID